MRINTGPSGNVEDRRGMGGIAAGGGLGALVLGLLYMLLGGDPSGGGAGGGVNVPGASPPGREVPADDEQAQFVSRVLASTEQTWGSIFQQQLGRQYQPAKLVLFTGGTPTGCGYGQSAMGPFYCPGDGGVYIDLSFYRDLEQRFQAPGDFARAYVLAHEVGHHVQNLLGLSEQVQQAQRAARSEAEANQYSVRLELQADCFAGLWANQAVKRGEIEINQADVQSGLNAASAIGDDRLQQQGQGHVVPESFTHGSSAQRMEWFNRGLETGDIRQCDTFQSR
ncbi:MAG TPA: neutral zinc metallopeptidase [Longimicrobium sp.]|nr:neutral zinc metallopeptidase [Longimicrobium sp.]